MLGGFLRAGMKMSSLFLQRISLWWNLTSTLVKIHSKGISDVHLHGLSDHRPVIAKFIAGVEAVSCRKLRKACRHSNDAKVNVEELLPRTFPASRFHSSQNHEIVLFDITR